MQHNLDIQGSISLSGNDALQPTGLYPDSGASGYIPSKLDLAHNNGSPDGSIFQWRCDDNGPQTHALNEILTIREHERQQLAQKLHDSAGQLVVALELSVARLKLVEKNCPHQSLIEEIQERVQAIDREIRSLAFLHYPVELAGRCICSAVQSLVSGFGRRTGIQVSFDCVGDPSPVDASISMAILRVAQEALVNIHRHSHASCVEVVLKRRPNLLHLTISDNGVGFSNVDAPQIVNGIGLQGMRHRIEMLGGRFRIRNLERGAKISAIVPVPMPGSADF